MIVLLALAGYAEKSTKFYSLKLNNYFDFGLVDNSDKYAIECWENTLAKMDYDADIVFFGNSITRRSDFRQYFPDKKIVNLGYSGDYPEAMLRRVGQIKTVHPKKVFLMAGVNKLHHYSDEQFETKYRRLVDSISAAVPGARIYLQSILPHTAKCKSVASNARIVEANAIIKAVAQEKGMTYVDLYSLYDVDGNLPDDMSIDGLHLKDESYSLWAECIRQFVYE